MNTYRGVPGETPALAIYDSSFKEISHSEKKLLNGSYHLVPLRVWNDEVLFTDLLCDTLYSLTPDGSISAKYHLNFGEQTLPGAIDGSSRSSDRAAYWNLPQNRSLFSAVAIPVCQDDIYLYIPYIFGEGKLNLLCYDKRTGKSHAYRLWDPVIRKPVQFTYFTVHDNNLYFVLRADEETADNPLILRIGSEIFSNQ